MGLYWEQILTINKEDHSIIYIGTSFFYEPKNLWISDKSDSGGSGLVPLGFGWFRVVLTNLEVHRSLRSVPMTQKRSLGPHNSNPESGADHLNVSEDRNLRSEPPTNRERKSPKIEKSRSKVWKIMKILIFCIFSCMLFVRYPWMLWGLGNVSKRLLTVFFGRARRLLGHRERL